MRDEHAFDEAVVPGVLAFITEIGGLQATRRSYRRPHGERSAGTEDALKRTLYGWAGELDTGRKFWWADWAKPIGDAITAVRTGEAVLYPEDEEG